ncbi:hypothetical protein A2U01_0108320, partial [Trifolium medium]|nr:hypothetical protein [Trifolium medium]
IRTKQSFRAYINFRGCEVQRLYCLRGSGRGWRASEAEELQKLEPSELQKLDHQSF